MPFLGANRSINASRLAREIDLPFSSALQVPGFDVADVVASGGTSGAEGLMAVTYEGSNTSAFIRHIKCHTSQQTPNKSSPIFFSLRT
jgi:hypothetical protein